MAHSATSSRISSKDPAMDTFSQLGREIAGPLLMGMIEWMAGCLLHSRPDLILFLSRDGDILKKLWEKCCPAELAGIPTRYVLASRRALWLASLRKVDDAATKALTSQAAGLSIRQVFRRAGLDEAAFLPVLSRQPGLAPDLKFSINLEAAVHQSFKELEPDLLRSASRERKAYSRYLEAEGLTGKSRLAIVDVGWHGSLQLALAALLRDQGDKLETDGYYCGIFPDAMARQTEKDRFHGYLLQGDFPEARFQELQRFVELVEFFFSSPDKSLLYFEQSDSGVPLPVFCSDSPSDYQQQALQALQAACLDLAADDSAIPDDPFTSLKRLGLNPTRQEAACLGPLEASRGFGDVRHLQPFAAARSSVGNLLHWGRFHRDFKNALWRPGYWAQLSAIEKQLLKILSPEGTKALQE